MFLEVDCTYTKIHSFTSNLCHRPGDKIKIPIWEIMQTKFPEFSFPRSKMDYCNHPRKVSYNCENFVPLPI